MGVMYCSRNSCDMIMCDTYVDGIGYICSDCQDEFKEYLNKEGISATTEGEIRCSLGTFMKTRKGDYAQGNQMDVDEFFKIHTNK